ncbi:MAG: hypothetical protein AB7M05_17420 [Alphaproteobacteria bacterium]
MAFAISKLDAVHLHHAIKEISPSRDNKLLIRAFKEGKASAFIEVIIPVTPPFDVAVPIPDWKWRGIPDEEFKVYRKVRGRLKRFIYWMVPDFCSQEVAIDQLRRSERHRIYFAENASEEVKSELKVALDAAWSKKHPVLIPVGEIKKMTAVDSRPKSQRGARGWLHNQEFDTWISRLLAKIDPSVKRPTAKELMADATMATWLEEKGVDIRQRNTLTKRASAKITAWEREYHRKKDH